MAKTGPSPISSGRHPAVAKLTNLASGFRFNAWARSDDMTTVAAAPSEVCDEFPAVTVPLAWKAGLSLANASRDVSARGPSSRLNSLVLTSGLAGFFVGVGFVTVTGTISSSNLPEWVAAGGFSWVLR